MSREGAVYSHGHQKEVTADHSLRTAQDSAAFLLPHLKPHFTILDIGCGTGTITLGLAEQVPRGTVIGGDRADTVLKQARNLAKTRGIHNAQFQVLDANDLPFKDGTFDVVYCHQVLHHVKDPVRILSEMRRVTKKGGMVAAREADYASFAWYPASTGLSRWSELFQQVCRANGGEPNAGRHVHAWARQAGFRGDEIEASWSTWRYSGDRVIHFANSWSARLLLPGFAETAKANGFAVDKELQEVSNDWREWGQMEDAFVAIPSGEIICRKS